MHFVAPIENTCLRRPPFRWQFKAGTPAARRRSDMLLQTMKKRLIEAMKAGRAVEKEILKVAIGEIEVQDARGVVKGEEDPITIVRKLVKANEETLTMTTDAEAKARLVEENVILNAFLPQQMGVDQIVAALESQRDAIRAAGNDGQATGVAMKHLKTTGASVNGKDVTEAVKKIRA
jgi:uncharacterized protein YqeY